MYLIRVKYVEEELAKRKGFKGDGEEEEEGEEQEKRFAFHFLSLEALNTAILNISTFTVRGLVLAVGIWPSTVDVVEEDDYGKFRPERVINV